MSEDFTVPSLERIVAGLSPEDPRYVVAVEQGLDIISKLGIQYDVETRTFVTANYADLTKRLREVDGLDVQAHPLEEHQVEFADAVYHAVAGEQGLSGSSKALREARRISEAWQRNSFKTIHVFGGRFIELQNARKELSEALLDLTRISPLSPQDPRHMEAVFYIPRGKEVYQARGDYDREAGEAYYDLPRVNPHLTPNLFVEQTDTVLEAAKDSKNVYLVTNPSERVDINPLTLKAIELARESLVSELDKERAGWGPLDYLRAALGRK